MRGLHLISALAICGVLLAFPATAAAKPANPCLDEQRVKFLRCPDLVMKRPFGLVLDPVVKPGRLVLRAGNSIDNVGTGPAELFGTRIGPEFMRARQRIYRKRAFRGKRRLGIATGARLFFKFVPGQVRYWKFDHAASLALWRLDEDGERTRLARRGPKVSYCLRDLQHSRPQTPFSPPNRVYPACDTSSSTRKVKLGTSVGWSDVYPPAYPEQWVDVTGLRGCFAYRHVADPRDGIFESDERNNSATTIVRLPFRYGNQRCPGHRSIINQASGNPIY